MYDELQEGAQERRPQVLVIDDEPGNLRMMAGALEDEFEVLTATGGDEGLNLLNDEVAVLLCDERMPGLRGIDVLREARRRCETVSRVLVTAYPDKSLLASAINEGGVRRYLEKPFAPEELVSLVRQEARYVALVRADAARSAELAIRNRIANVFLTTSGDEMFAMLRGEVLEAAQSRCGILGIVDESGAVIAHQVVCEERDAGAAAARSRVIERVDWSGIWSPTLAEGKTVRHNSEVAIPAQPQPVQRALGVPIVHRDCVIASLIVGQRETDYGADAVLLLETLATAIAPVLQARLERDRKERERASEERARHHVEKQIQQAQKLESLGVLAGGIAHDFNNILTGVLGNASLALARLGPESPAREEIEQVEKAAKWAAELTQQMLAYSGRGRFLVVPLDIGKIVTEMAHLLDAATSKKAVIKYSLMAGIPPIMADSAQVRQVVMNLITNASDAIGDASGVITVGTGLIEADRGYLRDTFIDWDLKEGRFVWLEVSDTGCGMEEATVAKIFDPFFTTKFTGRGLGLAAVLGIVRGHEGALKIYSEPGKGTTFKVLFPAASEQDKVDFVSPINAEGWKGEGVALLVDDEEVVRRTAGAVLKRLGFEVLVAADGREALELFEANIDSVRVVLLDMTMPVMDGSETFRELKRLRPDVRVVLSSGYNEQEATSSFAGKGLAGFIQKPYSARKLAAILRGILEG